MENDEKIASIITQLVSLSDKVDSKTFPVEDGFEKISITYDDHCYMMCLSNKKIYVVKKRLTPKSITSNNIPNLNSNLIDMWI